MKAYGIEEKKNIFELNGEEKTRLAKAENVKDRDPFDLFGHGINSYFNLMSLIMKILFLLTLIFTPVMYYYSQGKEYVNSATYLWSAVSMGNLGFTKSECQTVYTS